ncbi:PRC-barrel domain-containing protein [Niallia oryzisoli]|uniref:PRC-barrel domain-containing protein n=1 Tax=Niallia oryzisoli TaxID=1737571 RepID=UPI003736AFC5
MKNSAQIIGLPIISISDGIQIGIVKSLVINPEKGSIDFLTIEHEDWQGSVKAIPFKKVIGIGEFAVTIEGSNAVIDLNEIPIANQLVNKKIKLKNTRVMTRKGELIGEINEYFVDEETGQILGMELKTSNQDAAISSEFVLTYGKDIIIVKEEASKNFLGNIADLDTNVSETEVHPTVVNDNRRAGAANAVESQNDELAALKRKQIDLLKDKIVAKTIYDSKGQVLFEAGTKLTPADITKAQDDSPGTVVEVSMNVEA